MIILMSIIIITINAVLIVITAVLLLQGALRDALPGMRTPTGAGTLGHRASHRSVATLPPASRGHAIDWPSTCQADLAKPASRLEQLTKHIPGYQLSLSNASSIVGVRCQH